MLHFLKNNKWKILLTSILTLLPIAVGLILWDKLPLTMSTHWGADGNADGTAGKTFVVFGLPLIMLAVHLVCVIVTALDKGNRNQNKKVLSLVLCIGPVISFFASGTIYAAALGNGFDISLLMVIFLGLVFIGIGNYMPKCKQNSTIGVKIKWTLANEENWNVTHRLTGKVWVIGGVVIMAMTFLPFAFRISAFFAAVVIMVAIPCVYSAYYYKKQVREGRADPNPPSVISKKNKPALVGTIIGSVILSVVLVFVCFTGEIQFVCTDSAITVEADYFDDLTVEYSHILSVEYRESDSVGMRQYGFGSPRLLMGRFKNNEFGYYTRYSYTGGGAAVVLTTESGVLVLGGKDADATHAIYEALIAHIGE